VSYRRKNKNTATDYILHMIFDSSIIVLRTFPYVLRSQHHPKSEAESTDVDHRDLKKKC